jgi:hypothetical protein
LDYTPKSASVLRILLTSNTGVQVGEGNLITTTDTKPRSVVDISGIWYDPDTNGSGLNFQQRFRFDDLTFGTWYLYDQAGTARWYSIQNVVWNADGRSFEGKLLETRSATAACPQPGIPCPQTSTALNQVGIVKMTLAGDEFARDGSLRMKVDAVSATNVLLFSSTVRKIVF